MSLCYIGLGSNLGESNTYLQKAVRALRRLPASRLCGCSPFYRSAAIGCAAHTADFYNAVVCLQTALPPRRLFAKLRAVEVAANQRQRRGRNQPRRLDIDLLCYGSVRVISKALTLPHPRMFARAFVLLPLLTLLTPTAPSSASLYQKAQRAARALSPQRITRV